MPKRFRTTRRRKSTKRARRARRPKQMNRMQRTALSYVRKKYTVVLPLIAQEGQNAIAGTISHIGGRNGSNPSDTITLTSANPDNMASEDMSLYQYFKISGVGYKLFFPEGTTPQATPVQWSLAYSANNVLNPALTAGPFQSLATFQTSSCSAKNPVKRYFNTASTLKRLGIEWCNTDEYSSFGNTPPLALYGDQLPENQGSSTLFKVFRPDTATDSADAIARIQVTYYVQYKGTKG